MPTLALRLDQLPDEILRQRQNAMRTDGLDKLGPEYTTLGFSATANQGDVVDITAAALRTDSVLAPKHLPPGVAKVFKVLVNMRSDDRELYGLAPGSTAYLSALAYNSLKASGYVTDAP